MRIRWAVPLVTVLLAATPAAPAGEDDPTRLVHEAIVDAPVDEVWAAFTTREGQEAWNVAHAEIELKVGGRFRTHYRPDGQLGDEGTIEQTVLSFDPGRMFSFRVTKPPAKFPFPDAITTMWTVLYFEPGGAKQTRLRCVCLGFDDSEQSKAMRKFFDAGNAYTFEQLRKHFRPEPPR